jgi:hypothetical protein
MAAAVRSRPGAPTLRVMGARRIDYFEFDFDDDLACPDCGRHWKAGDLFEPYEEVMDFVCGECGKMIAIVVFPTVDEIKRAAAAGNPKAIEELPSALEQEAFWKRLERLCLKSPEQLPDLDGDRLEFDWDMEEDEDDERWTVIRSGGAEVWREPAVWEGMSRFFEVEALLAERYGSRFDSLAPTEASMMYLYADRGHFDVPPGRERPEVRSRT